MGGGGGACFHAARCLGDTRTLAGGGGDAPQGPAVEPPPPWRSWTRAFLGPGPAGRRCPCAGVSAWKPPSGPARRPPLLTTTRFTGLVPSSPFSLQSSLHDPSGVAAFCTFALVRSRRRRPLCRWLLLIHPSPMARRRLVEALQLSRDLVIVECCQDQAEWAQEGSCSPPSLTAPHRVPLSKDTHGIYSLCFAPDGGQLAAGFGNGAVQLVDTMTGLPGPSLFPGPRVRQAITAVNFHRLKAGLLLAAGADGTISIYELSSQYPVASLTEQENEINALDVCRDGSTFATAGKDRHIRLYDSHTNQLFHVMEAPNFMAGDEFTPHSGHSRRIFALCFHPMELHLFLTGGWDNSVKIWDKRVNKGAQGMLSGPHICGPGIDIKGDQVLTASWVPRNALQMWDLRMTRLWQNLPFPGSLTQGEFLYSARFCTGNVVMAGGSGTCGASLLHVGTGQVVGEIHLPNKPVHVVASAPGGQLVAAAGAGGNLHFAELN